MVITGLGAISPIGNDIDTIWENAVNGHSPAAHITKFDASAFRTQFACELQNFDIKEHLDRADIKRSDLFTQYALVASDQAIKDSGLDVEKEDPFRVGVIWGTGQGGMQTFEDEVIAYTESGFKPRFSPFFIPKLIANMASGVIAMRHGYMGVNFSTTSACATSNTAMMDAANYIKWGKADVVITGGSEGPITQASVGGFCAMKAMSARNDDPKTASRPFDVGRDGFVMGEGAASLVLEEYEHAKARGAKIYGEVAGSSMTADAYHLTATHPEGLGASQSMRQALAEGGYTIADVDYLNPHATSTPVGDISEVKAVLNLVGNGESKLHMSATKSMTGHLMGAAGAIEAIITVLAMNKNVIPPTINTEELDPSIPDSVQIVLKDAIEKEIKVALSNTFGFGGHNATVVFAKI